VLNACDPASRLLAEVVPDGVRVQHYAACAEPHAPAALRARHVDTRPDGQRIDVDAADDVQALAGRLSVSTLGDFNVDNALCAALAAHSAGLPVDAIRSGLAAFTGVEGRFQIVATAPLCVVDFAHTPDALERSLASARRLAAERGGRLALVFGCGGERDRAKRAPMGELADRLADAVWLTTDNPRGEPVEAIANAVRAGMRGRALLHEVPARAQAIADALGWAADRDVVLVAGRGHERQQHLASGPVASCDRDLVRAALATRQR
jgi:UDP-N-acetylmuramoyl-L-alanyl-D-glutamate--2,6-diaminopimelate ligase